MRTVKIEPALNGFIVTIGCTRVVFTDIKTLCTELRRYQENPDEVEGEYTRLAINKSRGEGLEAPPTCGPSEVPVVPGVTCAR